jgi:hypothetical protein
MNDNREKNGGLILQARRHLLLALVRRSLRMMRIRGLNPWWE